MESKFETSSKIAKDAIIEIHGLKVALLINAIQFNEIPDPYHADVWIVNHPDGWLVNRFLRTVIQSDDPRVYLKPIFLQEGLKKGYKRKVDLLEHLCDGFILDLNITSYLPVIQRAINFIKEREHLFPINCDGFSREAILTQKIFDFYYTRQEDMFPIVYPKSHSGYSFPRIEAFYYDKEDAFLGSRDLLIRAHKKGYLRRHYLDTVHLCKECYGGFLNYREICPDCKSHNLKSKLLIHHFRCSYVGKAEDFGTEDHMICPKCNRELKGLGTDYDQPGYIFECQNCNKEFQEPNIGVKCINCGIEQCSEELQVKKAYGYEITEKGTDFGLNDGIYNNV